MNLSKRFYCILCLLIFSISTAAQTPKADTTAYQLLVRHTDAWSMHNAEVIDDVFNENAVYEDVAYGAVMHGREKIKAFLKDTFNEIPDFTVKIVSWFSCGNRLACEWVMSGTLTDDSNDIQTIVKTFSVRGTSIATIKNGKFERWTDYYDK